MDEQDIRKQKANEAIQAIQYHAACIHALVEPGMTIDILIPNDTSLIVPNMPREMGRLIITRPYSLVKIAPK
jgi:hypothetical protein